MVRLRDQLRLIPKSFELLTSTRNTEERGGEMNEEDRERIRRMYYVEKQSIHQIARDEGRNRTIIREALSDAPKPLNPLPRQKPKPVFGAYKERVEQLLQENEKLPRKQRYTIH